MTKNTLGDGPIEHRYEFAMRAIAQAVSDFLKGAFAPKETGFILLVFPLNDHRGRCNYMSNAQREDVVTLLKEQLAYFEGQPDVEGKA